VGFRAVLDAVAERKIPSPRRESNPRADSNRNRILKSLFRMSDVDIFGHSVRSLYWHPVSFYKNRLDYFRLLLVLFTKY
jgi:hypothetical protein